MANEWTEHDLREQLRRVQGNGILVMLRTSAQKHGLPLAYVLAVASRETNCRNILGDGGHGHGIMQLDNRSHPIPADWKQDPSGIIDVCCGVLADGVAWAAKRWKSFTDDQHFKIGAAAYNCGPANAEHGVAAGDADLRTTGGDYGADVLKRAAAFALLLGGPG